MDLAYGSGSTVQRTVECPAWLVLPHIGSSPHEACDHGIDVHRFLQRWNEVGREEALAELDEGEFFQLCRALDRDRLPPIERGQAEVAYAVNMRTLAVRRLGVGLPREEAYASVTRDEIPLTIDLEFLDDGIVVVCDFKTGWIDVAPPKRNGQLLLGAYASATYHETPGARGEVVTVRKDRSPWRERDRLSWGELAAFTVRLMAVPDQLAEASSRIEDGSLPTVSEGPHCRYCPAAWSCPAKIGLLHGAITGERLENLRDLVVNPHTAGHLYLRLSEMKDLVNDALGRIHALATHQPIQITEGKVMEEREKLGQSKLDGDQAYEYIRERYGQDAADSVVKHEVTIGRIKSMLRARDDVDKVAPVEREIRQDLEGMGALHRPTVRKVDIYTTEEAEE